MGHLLLYAPARRGGGSGGMPVPGMAWHGSQLQRAEADTNRHQRQGFLSTFCTDPELQVRALPWALVTYVLVLGPIYPPRLCN